MDIFTTIAILCQVHASAASPKRIDAQQLKCQQYYVDCMNSKGQVWSEFQLKACIIERK